MTQLSADIQTRLELAIQGAEAAGRLTLDFFQREDLQVERKGDQSPVTAADRAAEQLLKQRVLQAFPNDSFLGEEFGEVQGTSGFRWVIDPIDGTKSFIGGVPLYSTLVGLLHHDQSVAGVIYIPGLDEIVYAAKGGGAWYRKGSAAVRRAAVSKRPRLSDGIFVTSQVDTFDSRDAGEAFRRLQSSAYVTRTWGDGYGYLLVATGRAEVMVDPKMNLWDAAAIQPVLEEAGGTFTDWTGVASVAGGEGIATNGLVLNEVLAITRDYPRPW